MYISNTEQQTFILWSSVISPMVISNIYELIYSCHYIISVLITKIVLLVYLCQVIHYVYVSKLSEKNTHFFTDPGFPKSQWQPPQPSPTSQGMLITINCFFKCIVPTFTT